jgi:hypothetical protein
MSPLRFMTLAALETCAIDGVAVNTFDDISSAGSERRDETHQTHQRREMSLIL